MERLIIDMDPGIDDAAALFFALASPEVSIDLITTVFGNVTVEQATVNAQRLLAFASRGDIPVRRGAAKPPVVDRGCSRPVRLWLTRGHIALPCGLPLYARPARRCDR